jgi:hypothetical protein
MISMSSQAQKVDCNRASTRQVAEDGQGTGKENSEREGFTAVQEAARGKWEGQLGGDNQV